MPTKLEVLEELKRSELSAAVKRYGLAVRDLRVRALLVAALDSSREVSLAEILSGLDRERLRELCQALGLDDDASTDAVLVERLVGDDLERRPNPTWTAQVPTEATEAGDGREVREPPSVIYEANEDFDEESASPDLRQDSSARVGVYADVAHLYRNGGQRLQYDALRAFACRDMAEPARLNAYVLYDLERARRDPAYRDGASSFHAKLRDYGYKVIVKDVQWYDDSGGRYGKADAGLALAVDALLQSARLDRVLIASGDADFVTVVRALQNRGCRVEVVGLDNTSPELRAEADLYFSGFLIPGLIPFTRYEPHRDTGTRVRGWCYWSDVDRGFGYMRFLGEIGPGLWYVDSRHSGSPYETAYFHHSSLPRTVRLDALPDPDYIFEFEAVKAQEGTGYQATDIELISRPSSRASHLEPMRS